VKDLDYDMYIAQCAVDALSALAEGIIAFGERDYRSGARACLLASALSASAAATLAERWVRRVFS